MDDTRTTTMLIWSVIALAGVLLAGAALAIERRAYARRGLGGAWLWLRLWTLPILGLSALSVYVPATQMRGPEALAVMYLLLFTLAPGLYFALHLGVGRLAKPPLARRDSAGIALSGLLLIIVPAVFVQLAQGPVHALARFIQQARLDGLPATPLPHSIVKQRRFDLPAGLMWSERWQAPAGVVTERVEQRIDGVFVRADGGGASTLCRLGEDVYVFWPLDRPLPNLRVIWRDAQGRQHRSDVATGPPQTPTAPFTVTWTQSGLQLAAPVPTSIALIDRRPEGSAENFESPLPAPIGSDAEACLPADYQLMPMSTGDSVRTFALRFWNRTTQAPLFVRWQRAVTASESTLR
jgi:hypothetical protein